MTEGKLQWHPAFSAALRIEFEEELDVLIIEEEHLLGKKPLQVDVLVIKKNRNMPIRKNIGRIFREHNIIEYKAPDDYLSINDFYKAYYSDVMDLIVRANWKQMKEEKEMCEALRELFAEELEESKETGRREGME